MRKKPTRKPIYETFREACRLKDTNLTRVLNSVGRSDGNTGAWKTGAYPKLDIAMDIAEYLGISLDELCYGIRHAKSLHLTDNQREWLDIISRIPEDRQEICKEFLKTHATVPKKHKDEKKKIS